MRVFLFFCFLFACTQSNAADYRFHALIDADSNSQTGCGAAANGAGYEIRATARSNREQRLETRLDSCQNGVWTSEQIDHSTQALGLGLGRLSSDAVYWSMPRQWLAAYPHLSIQMFAERLDAPAVDRLAADGQWTTLVLPLLSADANAVPTFGWPALLLLVASLLIAVQLRSKFGSSTYALLGLALLGLLSATQPSAIAQSTAISADDVGNDSTDPGADILYAQVSSSAERIQFEVQVNNIEADGLPANAKVLFIGNSLTYSNDMPKMLTAIAAQAGKQLRADEITSPGAALEDHFRTRSAHAALANGGYQVVIMQQGPSSLPASQAHLREWTTRYAPLIRAGGARPALYMVWPDVTRLDFFDAVRDSYSNAALAVDGMFIPAGETWRAAWTSNADLPLYGGDQFHPSALGSYAAALSIYAQLYRQSPVGLPAQLRLEGGQSHIFDQTQAHAVQVAAWAAYLQHGRAGR